MRTSIKAEIIDAWKRYIEAGNDEPTTMKLSLVKAIDVCRLRRGDLGEQLSQQLLMQGPRHLEESGLFGLKVVITKDGPPIAFE